MLVLCLLLGRISDVALTDLNKKPARYWSKSAFSTRSACDACDNNYGEAFNAAIISARFMSIVSMFNELRHYCMNRLVEKKKLCQSWKGELCPKIAAKIESSRRQSIFCHIRFNGHYDYEVDYDGETYAVHLQKRTCTCRIWDLTGIPCMHAITCILNRGKSRGIHTRMLF